MLYFASLFVFVGGPLLSGTVTSLLRGSAQMARFGTIPNIFIVALNLSISQTLDL